MIPIEFTADKKLFEQDAVTAAQDMLGRLLLYMPDPQNIAHIGQPVNIDALKDFETPDISDPLLSFVDNNRIMMGVITETEAYHGFEDKGAHAYKGITPRNSTMFGVGGHIYIYQIYGIYNCLNIITYKEGIPSGVLIRSIEPVSGFEMMANNAGVKDLSKYKNFDAFRAALGVGPGRLCRALGLNTSFRGLKLGKESGIYIGKHKNIRSEIISSPRVNIDYAEESKDWMWRFFLKSNKFVTSHKNNKLSKDLT